MSINADVGFSVVQSGFDPTEKCLICYGFLGKKVVIMHDGTCPIHKKCFEIWDKNQQRLNLPMQCLYINCKRVFLRPVNVISVESLTLRQRLEIKVQRYRLENPEGSPFLELQARLPGFAGLIAGLGAFSLDSGLITSLIIGVIAVIATLKISRAAEAVFADNILVLMDMVGAMRRGDFGQIVVEPFERGEKIFYVSMFALLILVVLIDKYVPK